MASVLLVEDDHSTAELLRCILQSSGYAITHYSDGRMALESAMAKRPDIILLDLRLPGLDGWEFAQQARMNASLTNVPIIAVSVRVSEEDERRALEAGCTRYVSKPFSVNELRQTVKQFLNA